MINLYNEEKEKQIVNIRKKIDSPSLVYMALENNKQFNIYPNQGKTKLNYKTYSEAVGLITNGFYF